MGGFGGEVQSIYEKYTKTVNLNFVVVIFSLKTGAAEKFTDFALRTNNIKEGWHIRKEWLQIDWKFTVVAPETEFVIHFINKCQVFH